MLNTILEKLQLGFAFQNTNLINGVSDLNYLEYVSFFLYHELKRSESVTGIFAVSSVMELPVKRIFLGKDVKQSNRFLDVVLSFSRHLDLFA